MNVPVRDLKAKLSRYLKDARVGRDVVVPSRGRPVARLLAAPGEVGGEPPGHELLRSGLSGSVPAVRRAATPISFEGARRN
jgi:prevent-host-death family protein